MTKRCLAEAELVSVCTRSTPQASITTSMHHTSDVIRVINIIVVLNYSNMNGSGDDRIVEGNPLALCMIQTSGVHYMDGLSARISEQELTVSD